MIYNTTDFFKWYLSMLVVVAYEFPQLLLSALQCGVQLLHLTHQICLLHF